MRTLKTQSTISPPEFDLTSSPNCIYHNYDIVTVAEHDDIPTMYHYTQDIMTKDEYTAYVREQLSEMRTALEILGVSV